MKQIVYVASPESQQIHVWRLKKGGDLALQQVVDVDGQAQPMVFNPQKPLLYVGVRPDFRVITYEIDAQGKLLKKAEIAIPASPTHLSTDEEGNRLFCSSYNGANLSILPLNEEGIPETPSQIIEGLEGCHSANWSNGKIFVPALKQDRIFIFEPSVNGNFHPCQQPWLETRKGAGPRHMVFHPSGKYAYCVNELNSTIDVWNSDPCATLIQSIQQVAMLPVNFEGKRWAADIHLTSDARFLYVCDRTANLLTGFEVTENGGKLRLIGYQKTETQPRGFNIDACGEYLGAVGQKSDHMSFYRIDSKTGKLSLLSRHKAGKGPMWVLFYDRVDGLN